MRVKVWGARGSVPAPGPEMNRYGGNTSCVEVTLSSGETLILDAGTGIRTLGFALPPEMPRINILLTHLHLDHIQGLMFFPPCFRAESTIRIWGPSSPEATLEARIARYISAPLSPVEVRELPCDVSFLDAPASEWQYRQRDDPRRGGDASRPDARLPDHRRRHRPSATSPTTSRRSAPRSTASTPEWISGYNLARDADLLIHDCQYTDEEYPGHEGWGHSMVNDTITFAHRVGAKRTLLFHHDPLHTDGFLDDLHLRARERCGELGGDPDRIEIAAERSELIVGSGESSGQRLDHAVAVAERRPLPASASENRLAKRFRGPGFTPVQTRCPRILDGGTNVGEVVADRRLIALAIHVRRSLRARR